MFEDDVKLAERIAQTVGEVLLAVQSSGLFEGKALGNAGDAVAHALIMEALKTNRPDDGILSEEGAADPARLGKSRVWIVDPLDGTREFSEKRTDWAVHIALSIDGHAALGAVALPGLKQVLSSGSAKTVAPPARKLKIAVSRTRAPEIAQTLAQKLDAELYPMGSAGAKTMAVVLGEVDAYVHAGGQYEWDSCAPVAVAAAAGLHVSRLDGSPLVYNREDTYLPDLVVATRACADAIMKGLNGQG